MVIEGYRTDAVHTFQIRTLRSLGYHARVALSNSSGANPRFATEYRVDVSVYGPTRTRERFLRDVARLRPDDKVVIDCAAFEPPSPEEALIIFHLIPLRLAPNDEATVGVAREELYALLTAQDHYVEYYRADGFCAGILYQSGAFNYDKFSREASTFVQAPKCYVSDQVDTLLSFVHSSLDPAYSRTAELRCCLRAPDGKQVGWTQTIAAFEPVLISVQERLRALGAAAPASALSFYAFYALCDTATLLPLTISRDQRSGAIAIEHSLPPLYYATGAVGQARAQMVKQLGDSLLFGAGRR